MIGGARYCGTSPRDAKIILNNSENKKSHGFEHRVSAHSRGHAVHPSGFSIVDYSQTEPKTAFQSRDDQDYITHLALSTSMAQNAMNKLNEGSFTEAVTISSVNLRNSRRLPKVVIYDKGSLVQEVDMTEVVLVLRHHIGQYRNPNADVLVHTCYPAMPEFQQYLAEKSLLRKYKN